MAPRRRARSAATALALAAQLCLAGGAVVTPSAVVTPVVGAAPSAAPAPAPAPSVPQGTVGDIIIGLLVTGLSSYTPATQSALAAGVASVANSAAPSSAPITAADVTLNASSYAASAALVLQGLGLPSFPSNAATNLCFERSVSTVANVPMGDISVRPAGAAPQGVQVPFYIYSSSYTLADRYQTAIGNLGGSSSAALQTHLAACGIQCQGVLEPNPPALAAYLTARVALSATDAASQAAVVAALGHTTPYVVAFRNQGLPTSAAVQITSPAHYAMVPVPPPPRPPRPPKPPSPQAPHMRGGAHASGAGRARAAAAGALLAAAAAMAM